MVPAIPAPASPQALAVRSGPRASTAPPRTEPVAQPRRLGYLDPWRAQGVAAYGIVELPPRVLDVYV